MEKTLKIGDVARECQIGVPTIRYYEELGLLARASRLSSGYRVFPAHAVRRVKFIKRAQALGFSLAEIKEILDLRVTPSATCAQVRDHAEAKIHEVELKIETLERMKQALSRLAADCTGTGSVRECPILEALADEEEQPR